MWNFNHGGVDAEMSDILCRELMKRLPRVDEVFSLGDHTGPPGHDLMLWIIDSMARKCGYVVWVGDDTRRGRCVMTCHGSRSKIVYHWR